MANFAFNIKIDSKPQFFLDPWVGPQKNTKPTKIANFKIVADLSSGVSNTIRRKIQNQWKKLELNRAYQLREKSKKTPENTVFQKSDISGGFLDFSRNW